MQYYKDYQIHLFNHYVFRTIILHWPC